MVYREIQTQTFTFYFCLPIRMNAKTTGDNLMRMPVPNFGSEVTVNHRHLMMKIIITIKIMMMMMMMIECDVMMIMIMKPSVEIQEDS
jgi:hypothetical protein